MTDDERESRSVMLHRLATVEQGQKDLQAMVKEAVGQLGGQLTALQTQLAVWQQELPKSYTPRPEAAERHRGVEDRFDAIERRHEDYVAVTNNRIDHNIKRIERLESLGWGFVVGLVMSLGAALFAIVRTTPGGTP